jgi:calcineurin-like phosphoesterase family protein
MIYFTSDNHFGHKNIIEFCDRPFANVQEMDDEMIRRWNEVVRPKDRVYHLGDFTLSGRKQAAEYMSELNGGVVFLHIPWHHDRRWLQSTPGKAHLFRTATGQVDFLPPSWSLKLSENNFKNPVRQDPVYIHLSHYPLAVWDRKHYD